MDSNHSTDILGSSLSLPAYGREGQGQHLILLAAHFAMQNTKFGGGESEGGAGIHFPPTPFSARPARAVWFLPRRRRGIIRDFVQNRFAQRSVIATKLDIEHLKGNALARLARSRLLKNPAAKRQFAKHPTNPSRL
ncbi:MAG: hypothetical protein ACOZBZ_00005, partial [Patescibacteria group bacterium]